MQHKMIKGLRNYLEVLDKLDEIISIIPGKIITMKTKRNVDGILTRSRKLKNGVLCYAYSSGCRQEVYIIGDPDILWDVLG